MNPSATFVTGGFQPEVPALERARAFARLGFSIIPLKCRGKQSQGRWKPYQTECASDEELIEWFSGEGEPGANIGIVAGEVSNIVVVDTDNEPAEQWAARSLPETPFTTRTAKGRHRYYRHPGGVVRSRLKVAVCPGAVLDILSDRHYVVAPGSVHPTGFVYLAEGSWRHVSEMPTFDPGWFEQAAAFGETVRSVPPHPREASETCHISEWRQVEGEERPVEDIYPLLPLPLSSLLSETSEAARDDALSPQRAAARKGARRRWRRELQRFETLRNMRGGFRQGTRANAVMVLAYLLRKNLVSWEEIERESYRFARQCCRPPLPFGEIRHRVYCGVYTLRHNLTREQIDSWLYVSAGERRTLDAEAIARAERIGRKKATADAIREALEQLQGLSVRRIAEVLVDAGFQTTYSSVWRARSRKTEGSLREPVGVDDQSYLGKAA